MGFVDDLKKATGFEAEFLPEDSWQNRLVPAAYTPPSGLRITFDFEDLSRTITKKTSVFEFPDADGVYVQDHGVGPRRFPVRAYFSGPDHDKHAKIFVAAVQETGKGLLESPVYGEHEVVIVGDVTESTGLATGANQTAFDLVFVKTIGAIYPQQQNNAASDVMTAVDVFGSASDADFATSIQQTSISESQGILDTINDLTNQVGDVLDRVAAVQQVVKDRFDDAIDTVNNIIDTFVTQPLEIAFNTRILIQTPATALANINDRLDGYANLANQIFSAPDSISDPGGPGGGGPVIDSFTGSGNDAESPNRFHVRDFFVQNYCAASVLSIIYTGNTTGSAASIPSVQSRQADNIAANNTFESADQALLAATRILELYDAFVAWRDANYRNMIGDISAPSNTDTGDAISALQRVVGLGAGYLIDLSFSLARRKTLVLDKPRTILDLAWELYGDISDNVLNRFMDINDLSGDEIFELPVSRKVIYFD